MLSFKDYITENIISAGHKFQVDPMYDDHETSLHNMNIDKIEKSFSGDKDFYVSSNGANSKQSTMKYNRFKEFLSTKPKHIDAPSLHIDDSGKVQFENGRHRFAVFRDMGEKTIPVSLSKEARLNAKKFGYI